jgi:hypothetical protein
MRIATSLTGSRGVRYAPRSVRDCPRTPVKTTRRTNLVLRSIHWFVQID